MILKELKISDGKLSAIAAGRRFQIADFSGRVKITERTSYVSVLGKRYRQEKRIYASFIVGEEMEYLTDQPFMEVAVYEAEGVVEGEKQSQRFIFSGLRYVDSDPVTGEVEFEIPDQLLIQKMLSM